MANGASPGAPAADAGAGSTPTVGVVGLGRMGGAIAANLLSAGFRVIGFDVDPDRSAELASNGMLVAETVEAMADAEIVITSLPSEPALVAVAEGLREASRSGQLVMETSTLSVAAKQAAAELLAAVQVTLLDCPLSGTGHQAVHGDLVVLASGEEAAVRRCIPVTTAFARACHYLGPFGAGSRMKFIANLLVAIHNVAAAEALVLAGASGLDQELALRVLSDSAGGSRMLEVRGPRMLRGEYDSGVANLVFQKDLALIRAFAGEHHAPTPLFATSAELHLAAVANGFGELDTASVYEVLASLAGQAPRHRLDEGAVDA